MRGTARHRGLRDQAGWVALAGAIGVAAATLLMPGRAERAIQQAWPPFALVTGLLLIGVVAADDGLFEAAGSAVARLRGGNIVLYVGAMVLVATVTVVLTLDTSVVFLTPILLHTARRRRLDPAPLLYGCVFMSNSASLLLPGSNLTNLLVLAQEPVPGSTFAARMFPLWVTAVLVTAVVVGVWHRRALATSVQDGDKDAPWQLGLGLVATLVAIVLVLTLRSPALWVLVLGLAVAGSRLIRRRSKIADITTAVNVPLLAGLFGIMIALGTAARAWSGPADLMAHAGSVSSAALGAATSVVINNLPAAIVLASGIPAHPRSLLLGLDVGPNIAVTGSLSAIFWLQVARANGAEVSAARYARIGAVVAVASIASALAVMSLGS